MDFNSQFVLTPYISQGSLLRLTRHDHKMTIYLFNLYLLERRCLCITGILGQGMMGGGLSVFGNIGKFKRSLILLSCKYLGNLLFLHRLYLLHCRGMSEANKW